MFARWAECSPTSESSPLDNKKCPPLRSPNKLRREFRLTLTSKQVNYLLKRQSRRATGPGRVRKALFDDSRFILGKGE